MLLQAAATGLSVAVIHHSRKAPGELGDEARGSNAITAAADIVVVLKRLAGDDSMARLMEVLGRDEECPGAAVIRLEGGSYVRAGTASQVKKRDLEEEILKILPNRPDVGLTVDEVQELVKAKRKTVRDTLNDLVNEQRVEMTGAGRKGSPFRYRMQVSDSQTALCMIKVRLRHRLRFITPAR